MVADETHEPCFPEDPALVLAAGDAREALEILGEVVAALREARVEVGGPIAFDLDDTLVTGLSRTTRGPGDVPVTRPAVVWVLGRLLEAGWRILIVTGRDDETEAWSDLARALGEVCGRAVGPGVLGRIEMSCGGAWSGTRTAVARKVRALRAARALLLVGDLDHLDGRAARYADIPFVDVGPKHTGRRRGPSPAVQ